MVNSCRFTKEEIESETIQNAINELNESWIKAEIADRLVSSLMKEKEAENTEVAENNTKKNITVSLSNDKESATSEQIMRAFFS